MHREGEDRVMEEPWDFAFPLWYYKIEVDQVYGCIRRSLSVKIGGSIERWNGNTCLLWMVYPA